MSAAPPLLQAQDSYICCTLHNRQQVTPYAHLCCSNHKVTGKLVCASLGHPFCVPSTSRLFVVGCMQGDVGFPSHFQHIFEEELGSAADWQQAIDPE